MLTCVAHLLGQLMRCDMGGGAACVSTVYAAAKLALPVNIVCVVPLTENLISGHATKPGDLVKAMNGLTIDVDNPGEQPSAPSCPGSCLHCTLP